MRPWPEWLSWAGGLFISVVQIFQVGRPTVVLRLHGPLFLHQAAKFVYPELGNQKFQAGARPVAFLTQTGKDAADGLGQWQQFLFRDECL
jgi:hypothetical protein